MCRQKQFLTSIPVKRERIVRTVHNVYEEAGNVVREKLFDLGQKPTGTLRFLSYVQNVIEMVSNGGIYRG